jgi:hypothetical protein
MSQGNRSGEEQRIILYGKTQCDSIFNSLFLLAIVIACGVVRIVNFSAEILIFYCILKIPCCAL